MNFNSARHFVKRHHVELIGLLIITFGRIRQLVDTETRTSDRKHILTLQQLIVK
jgi:hypothetical protein